MTSVLPVQVRSAAPEKQKALFRVPFVFLMSLQDAEHRSEASEDSRGDKSFLTEQTNARIVQQSGQLIFVF